MSQRARSWHIVGSKQVLALVSQDDEQGAPVFWETKRGRKLRLEKPNQVRTGPFSSSAANSGWETGFSHNKSRGGDIRLRTVK